MLVREPSEVLCLVRNRPQDEHEVFVGERICMSSSRGTPGLCRCGVDV